MSFDGISFGDKTEIMGVRLIINFGNFVFDFFHHFGCMIFFTLNFCFACIALLSKKSKETIT